ncbi:MAG: TonB-dependent receptor [Flavobacteriaceae bacterium]|nr:TonB-dependent receptor [Flavobacteriaceae bacterium]
MKNIQLLIFIIFVNTISSQQLYTFSGIVKDKDSGETLIDATIMISDINRGVTTNEYGYFSINLPSSTYKVIISYIGYEFIEETIELNKNIRENYSLSMLSSELEEVSLSYNYKKLNLRKAETSVHKLNIEEVKSIPMVLGEIDPIKSLSSLPGVSNAGENTIGFNVRGGAADQNLITIDEAVIYNPNHLIGLVSSFNGDAIKSMKLYKGGIPAKYGGRISSYLDIKLKDGNTKHIKVEGGIGVVSSRLMIEGPINNKENGSFLISGRTSYVENVAKIFTDIKGFRLGFYDLNAKVNYNLNENNRLFISSYLGKDDIRWNEIHNDFGNFTSIIRWNNIINNKLFSNLSLIHSNYEYNLKLDYKAMSWESGIKSYNVKYDLSNNYSDVLNIEYGLASTYYVLNPGYITPSEAGSLIVVKKLQDKKAIESALYISADYELNDNISIRLGLRYSMFHRLGNYTLKLYQNNAPIIYDDQLGVYTKGIVTSEKDYGSESIAVFSEPEPRLAISFVLDDHNSLKFGYNRTIQYMHLLSNTISPTPYDNWIPSGKYIEPKKANQYNIGLYNNSDDYIYSTQIEAYYKETKNILDYIDGVDFIAIENVEQNILRGEAVSYGLELMVKKNKGNFTGWISCTISKAKQRAKGDIEGGPGVNNGDWYYSNQDRLIDISIVGMNKLTKRWSTGFNFTYQTGRPSTFPESRYSYGDFLLPSYSDRNTDRYTPYHHLDIFFTRKRKANQRRRWKGEWVYSIYNVYNRQNMDLIYFDNEEEGGSATKFSYFGIVPSISYNFKF